MMKRVLKILALCLAIVLFCGACAAMYFGYVWSSNLPYIGALKDYEPPIITELYSKDGEVIARFWREKRVIVPLEQLPPHLIQAFVAAEDSRFFKHEGVDLVSIFRAFVKNLVARKIKQGGSTITQQVTKSLLLRNTKKTYRRKAREALLSIQLEKSLSKEKILFLYLNEIYLGHGAYGVEAAAQTYFNKPASELSLAESAMLAGLPQAPASYSPVSHFDLAKNRQKYVLTRMYEEKYITENQLKVAIETPIEISEKQESSFQKVPYFSEYVRQYLERKYGKDLLYTGGLKVYTTLDLTAQNYAKAALLKGLYDLDKREGYNGPLRHIPKDEMASFLSEAEENFDKESLVGDAVLEAIVIEVRDKKKEVIVKFGPCMGRLPLSEMKWARKPDPEVAYFEARVRKPSEVLKRGDVILVRLLKEGKSSNNWEVGLEQNPEAQGAILCIVPHTGEIKAMVGGKDFSASQFNRAVQSRRQPGSAFKPIIYSAALDWGMNPASVLIDAPYISYDTPDEKAWKPSNYKEKFFGPTLFRTGLAKSRNVITVKILKKIGIKYAIEYARRMGIESDLSPDLSLALGSSGLSLMELTRAYSIFANEGTMAKPIFINKIVDRRGEIIEENTTETKDVLSKQTAYVMTTLMQAVIKEGTGWRIRKLQRPCAGKTGTTNNLWDAWFMGYTPNLVTGVWVGYDDHRPMGKGETGSRAASPIWLDFMSKILEGKPIVDFAVPDGVLFAKIDGETGLLAGPYSKKTVFQAFVEGTEPKEYAPRPETPKLGGFFQYDMDDTN